MTHESFENPNPILTLGINSGILDKDGFVLVPGTKLYMQCCSFRHIKSETLCNLSEWSCGRVPTLEEATVMDKNIGEIRKTLRNLNFEDEFEELIEKITCDVEYSCCFWIMDCHDFKKWNFVDGSIYNVFTSPGEWMNLWAWEIRVKGSL